MAEKPQYSNPSEQSLNYIMGFMKGNTFTYVSKLTGTKESITFYSIYDIFTLKFIKSEKFYEEYMAVMKRLAVFPEEYQILCLEPFDSRWRTFLTMVTFEERKLEQLTSNTINRTNKLMDKILIPDATPQTTEALTNLLNSIKQDEENDEK